MLEIKDRIKKIRKDKGITQTEFGNKIGVKGNTVTNYENGMREPSDAVKKAICREYRVNIEWLEKGIGEPYKPKTVKEELVDLTDTLLSEESTSFKNRLVSALAKLSEEQWDLLENIIDEISKKD